MFKKLWIFVPALLVSASWAQTLTVLTHDSFAISQAVIDTFTQQTGIEVQFIQGGDAGETVNRAILTKARPLADILYGVDNNLIARAATAGIFEPYASPQLDNVPATYQFSENHLVTPIDVGFVNFNLDKGWFDKQKLPMPTDIAQLTDERYRGLTVVENPTTSSPGLAFLLTTIARFGTQGTSTWLDYWAALKDNDLMVSQSWSDAYNTAFSLYGGDRPIVLSYATSPAAEVVFAGKDLAASPTANLLCDACAYRQIEAAGILKGTPNRAAAETFIDYMLSERFQEDIPLNMFVYPVNEEAHIPEVFQKYAPIPNQQQTAHLDPDTIEVKLKTWLNQWTQVVEQGRAPEEVR